MPLSFVGVGVPVLLAMLAFSSFAVSPVIVDVEGDREKVLASGPRCVSLSSRRYVSDPKFRGAMDVELIKFRSHLRVVSQRQEVAEELAMALIGGSRAGLTLGQFPRHIDAAVDGVWKGGGVWRG
jgi:hypothetical protein